MLLILTHSQLFCSSLFKPESSSVKCRVRKTVWFIWRFIFFLFMTIFVQFKWSFLRVVFHELRPGFLSNSCLSCCYAPQTSYCFDSFLFNKNPAAWNVRVPLKLPECCRALSPDTLASVFLCPPRSVCKWQSCHGWLKLLSICGNADLLAFSFSFIPSLALWEFFYSCSKMMFYQIQQVYPNDTLQLFTPGLFLVCLDTTALSDAHQQHKQLLIFP